MQRFGVAFVADDEAAAGIPDLILGILICSMRVDEFLEFIRWPTSEQEINNWARRIRAKPPWYFRIALFGPIISASWIGRKWRALNSFNPIEKMHLFASYISESSKVPPYWDESPGSGVSGAHWSHSIEVALRSKLGWSEEEVNESPLSKALADYFKFCESEGHIRLMTKDEMDVPQLNEEQLAAFRQFAAFQEEPCQA